MRDYEYGRTRTFILSDNYGRLDADPWPRLRITTDPVGAGWMVDVHRVHGVDAATGEPVIGDVLLNRFLMHQDSVRDLMAMVRWLARIEVYLTSGRLDVAEAESLCWSAREVAE